MEGGGRLSLILAQQLGCDLAYGFKTRNHPFFETYPPCGKEFDLKVSGDFIGWRNIRLIQAFRQKTAFLKNYDKAVFSGFYAPLAVDNHTGGINIYYCHTPPRYIYDQRGFYYSTYPAWASPALRALIAYHRKWYERAVNRMDCIVTNSFHVKKRIKTFLGLDATVVYPPCETDKYQWIGQGNYFLSAARLDSLKRVDIIVAAFKAMPDQQLIVVSDGPELKKIRSSAENYNNITVLGRVSDPDYRRLMAECIATIYIPKDEDFGMTPIESMAAGKPVIGVNQGGLVETIVHNETGLLLAADPACSEVVQAVRWLDRKKAKRMMHDCQTQARRFDVAVFVSKMNELIN